MDCHWSRGKVSLATVTTAYGPVCRALKYSARINAVGFGEEIDILRTRSVFADAAC